MNEPIHGLKEVSNMHRPDILFMIQLQMSQANRLHLSLAKQMIVVPVPLKINCIFFFRISIYHVRYVWEDCSLPSPEVTIQIFNSCTS